MEKQTKYEYLALVMHRYNAEKGIWTNARMEAESHSESPWQRTGKRVCRSMEEAKMFIDWEVNAFKATSEDIEVTHKVGSVGCSIVLDLESQKRMEIIKTIIKRREVTEYEVMEEWSME